MATKPSTLLDYPRNERLPYGPYIGVVEREAYDGDTIHIQFDLGLREYPVVAVRLKDTRAPELREEGGEDVRNFLRGLLPVGKPVQVHTDSMEWSEKWSFERVVGEIFTYEWYSINRTVQAYVEMRGYGGGE